MKIKLDEEFFYLLSLIHYLQYCKEAVGNNVNIILGIFASIRKKGSKEVTEERDEKITLRSPQHPEYYSFLSLW